jgi:hypothetical protein
MKIMVEIIMPINRINQKYNEKGLEELLIYLHHAL